MKRILLSLVTIGIVSAGVFGATKAFFTDTEKSVGNTFSAGTIDIAVDDQNPWSATELYQFQDMKPSQTEYANFVIKNVGNNPANVWKKIENVVTNEGVMTEPECAEYGGTWVEHGDHCAGGTEKHDIDTVIDYDLSVEVYNGDPEEDGKPVWWQMIHNKDVTINDVRDTDIYLGMIPVGWSMKVTQSYHMQEDVTNWAQGDTMTFDITLTAEQLRGSLTLENKSGEPDWDIIQDEKSGILTYNVKGSTFDYTFVGSGLENSTGYSLIYYADPWPGNNPGAFIASGTSNGSGGLTLTGSVDLGMDLPHSTDANYPGGAKIWLVKSSDYNSGSASTGPMTAWNPSSYLFETGLITYDDTDL